MTAKLLNIILNLPFGKGSEIDVFAVWTHGAASLPSFLDFLNGIDETNKIKFTMQTADDSGIAFLDLKLIMQNGKISVDVFAKPTNSFTYVLPNTCYPSRNISNIPRGIALRIRRICDTDEKFCARSTEYLIII